MKLKTFMIKFTKNSSDILGFESRLKQKEDLTTELEREASFFLEEIIIIINKVIYSTNQKHTLLNKMLVK